MYPRNSIIRQRIAIQLHHYVVKYKIYIVKQFITKKKAMYDNKTYVFVVNIRNYCYVSNYILCVTL